MNAPPRTRILYRPDFIIGNRGEAVKRGSSGAGADLLLASPLAAYVIGQTIPVDGGLIQSWHDELRTSTVSR